MIGLILEWRRDRNALSKSQPGEPRFPRVSVVIPFRNEKERMRPLLESLAAQEYPELEFIFIDDRSSDGGGDLLRDFEKKVPAIPVTLIRLEENPGINRKQYALARGIEAADGELFLFTDADCTVPPGWVSAMAARMRNHGTGITIGPVFKKAQGRGFFQLYQCFDHAVRYMYLAASTGLGAAGGGFGNNLILRREALEAVGGYDAVPPSPTEDASLIAQIRARSRYKVRAACGSDVHVMTQGERTWRNFVSQTLRWNNGGLFSPDFSTRLNFGYLMAAISLGILCIVPALFVPWVWLLPAGVYISMTMNTIAVLALFRVSLPRAGLAYIFQLIFTPMYFTFLTILGVFGVKARWKGADLSCPD
ncbi:glycosyltransferase [Breznakiella homolactica]|uniref:Glycosyltransferase n=2 Tax=Breznakiella homolactica TaxID=2798577 RepID=A0A7T7XS67_9SPIR|nr:glycosyltransferase [Breznakiella homolactica]